MKVIGTVQELQDWLNEELKERRLKPESEITLKDEHGSENLAQFGVDRISRELIIK